MTWQKIFVLKRFQDRICKLCNLVPRWKGERGRRRGKSALLLQNSMIKEYIIPKIQEHRQLSIHAATAAAKSLQSCPTLCDPIDGSPLGSPIPRILQAKTLEWVAISFSNAWKGKVKVKSFSCVRLFATPWSAAYQAPLRPWDFPGKITGVGCHCLLWE